MYLQNLPKLCCDAVDCISAMASDSNLQISFLQKGAVWHLLNYMFSYDYTLEECGVERSEEANNQVNHYELISYHFLKLITNKNFKF